MVRGSVSTAAASESPLIIEAKVAKKNGGRDTCTRRKISFTGGSQSSTHFLCLFRIVVLDNIYMTI